LGLPAGGSGMGYACPVCEDPQADAGHLANHLAFTAMLRGGEHEAWLDDRVPEWEGLDEEGLGEAVADHAEQREFPQVFEDTTGGRGRSQGHGHGHDHDHNHSRGHPPRDDDLPPGVTPGDLDPDDDLDERAEQVLEEARELTRKRREDSEERSSSDARAGRDDPRDSEE